MATRNYPLDEPLPGSGYTAKSLGFDGVSVKDNAQGGLHVSCWKGADENTSAYRFSYDIDADGNYIPRSAHYTDNMSYVLREMGWDRW